MKRPVPPGHLSASQEDDRKMCIVLQASVFQVQLSSHQFMHMLSGLSAGASQSCLALMRSLEPDCFTGVVKKNECSLSVLCS